MTLSLGRVDISWYCNWFLQYLKLWKLWNWWWEWVSSNASRQLSVVVSCVGFETQDQVWDRDHQDQDSNRQDQDSENTVLGLSRDESMSRDSRLLIVTQFTEWRHSHLGKMLRLTSRKPSWLDLQPVDIKRWWRHNWKSAQVVNSHLVCDPTIRQLCFDLPRQQWSLLNRFRTEQGHCGACRRKWRLTDTDLCPCGDVSHYQILSPDKTEWRLISASLCGWSRCFVADNYGSWHAYQKKKARC